MDYLKQIIGNGNLKAFTTFLMDRIDVSVDHELDDCEKALTNSYDIMIAKIKELYPGASENDNDLLEAVSEFAFIHDEVYMKIGMVIGARIQRDLIKEYDNLDSSSKA